MYENEVWTSTDLPDDRQAIENKWIFNKKTELTARLEKAVGVSEAAGLRLVPRRCLSALGVA